MISAQEIIDRIKITSGYTDVNWIKEHSNDVVSVNNLPIIKVGYLSITSESQNRDTIYNSYRLGNEDLRQNFVIHITCSVESFDTVWKNIFGKATDGTAKLIGWNAGADNDNNTSVGYIDGKVIGLSQGIQKFQVVITTGFPTF